MRLWVLPVTKELADRKLDCRWSEFRLNVSVTLMQQQLFRICWWSCNSSCNNCSCSLWISWLMQFELVPPARAWVPAAAAASSTWSEESSDDVLGPAAAALVTWSGCCCCKVMGCSKVSAEAAGKAAASPIFTRQRGQVECECNQVSMHNRWKEWLHLGRMRKVSPSWYSLKHTEQPMFVQPCVFIRPSCWGCCWSSAPKVQVGMRPINASSNPIAFGDHIWSSIITCTKPRPGDPLMRIKHRRNKFEAHDAECAEAAPESSQLRTTSDLGQDDARGPKPWTEMQVRIGLRYTALTSVADGCGAAAAAASLEPHHGSTLRLQYLEKIR